MRRFLNISTCSYDMERYSGADDLTAFTRECGMDGIEVLPIGANSLNIIPRELLGGIHLSYNNCWMDFFRGDTARVIDEYGSLAEAVRQIGCAPDGMIDRLRAQLDWCESLAVPYVVFHVADVSIRETVTYVPLHTDMEVISASLELLNGALSGRNYSFEILLENLWWPGFTFTRPDITRALLSGVNYGRVGIMLDLGHLMHTDTSIDTQQAGIEYIHRCLDAHGALCGRIRGVHLHSGATGAYVRDMLSRPHEFSGTYFDRLCAVYENVLAIDRHEPLTCPGTRELIARIAPEYLTYEFITRSRDEHAAFIRAQSAALSSDE